MSFLTEAHKTGRGARMWVASLTRTIGKEPLRQMRHEFDEGRVLLWWGPVVEVKPGDRIYYFNSPSGIEVEWVETPTPDPDPMSQGGVTTLKFS